MSEPHLSVLVVTYNSRDHIERCLQSVIDNTTAGLEIIVIDNASSDGTAALVADRFPDVDLVASAENLGFAKGVNLAVSRASGANLVLLNPDTELRGPALDELLAFATANPGHGIYGGRTVDEDGVGDANSCWGPMTAWSLTCFGLGLTTLFKGSARFDPESMGSWQRDSVREVGMVTGCLTLVPTPVWHELDGLDERFWMYGEDADLSYRAREHGYRPIITPEAEIYHELGASSADRFANLEMVYRGKATLVRLHFPGWRCRYGLTMLQMGIGLRAAGSAVGALVRRRSPGSAPYVRMWRARRAWREGYDPVTP